MDQGSLAYYIPLYPEATVRVLTAVVDGLDYAHGHGIVHRDLKPENILFGTVDEDDIVKISDWGISHRLFEDDVGSSGLTLRFAAPEQLALNSNGDPYDYTDICHFSISTYEALTGQVSFHYNDRSETVQAIISKQLAPPSVVSPDVLVDVVRFVLKALVNCKEARYGSILYSRNALIADFN